MKKILFIIFIGTFFSCHDVTVGYLITEYASYEVDTLIIRKELDTLAPHWIDNPRYYELLNQGVPPETIMNWYNEMPQIIGGEGPDYYKNLRNIPWLTTSIEGIEGTQPRIIVIKDITSETGDPQKLKDCISIRGDGMMSVPLRNDVPVGRYKVSITVSNEGRSHDLFDVFTFIVI